MHIRTAIAVITAHFIRHACRITGRQGSALPGKAALRIDPMIIRNLASQSGARIIATCGTNGKTTTNNLLCTVLEANGLHVAGNRLGANMMEGVAAALAAAADPFGKLRADYICLEVDEASAPKVFEYIKPDCMIITNLFRDQLDRYGEIDLTMKSLEDAVKISPHTRLIINADDPLTAFCAMKTGREFVSYGISEKAAEDVQDYAHSHEVREGRFCESCGTRLQYDLYHFGQLGVYHCPSCGFKRPGIDYEASHVRLWKGLSFDILDKTSSTSEYIDVALTGFYNVYNILAVYSVLKEEGLSTAHFNEILQRSKPQFGRGEIFRFYQDGGKEQRVFLNLAKNPAGFNQNIYAVLQDREPKDLIIAINDNAQDGRDVSWLWDVDFDRLDDDTVRSVTVTGLRALDMQLRLKYVEIQSEYAPTVEEAIDRRLTDGCGNLYVLVNYTVLYEAHKYLEKMGSRK